MWEILTQAIDFVIIVCCKFFKTQFLFANFLKQNVNTYYKDISFVNTFYI